MFSTPDHANSFANLLMDGLNLMIPQGDIYSLEPATDMLANHDSTGVIGFFQEGLKQWPLYALSATLQLLAQRPHAYRVIVLMKNVELDYGLLCEQIYALKSEQIVLHPLPAIMQNPDSPLTQLAQYEEQVHCVSSAHHLLTRLFRHPI